MQITKREADGSNFSEIIKTEERIAVLRYISQNLSFTATDIVSSTGKSKGFISRYLRLLLKAGYITSSGRTYFWVDNAETRALKKLLNVQTLMSALDLPEWAKGIGCYGSFAEGTNSIESDLDLFIFVDNYSGELELKTAKLEKDTEKITGTETNILILTPGKLRDMQKNDAPFYNSLMRTVITLRGTGIETY